MNYYSSAFPVLTSSKGIAYEIYLAGCKGYCDGCHSKHTWDFNAGKPMEEVWPRLRDSLLENRKFFDNVVIMGGEPLDHDDLPVLLQELDKLLPDKDIYVYTHFGPVMVNKKFPWLKELVDYLKVGDYDPGCPPGEPDPLTGVTLATSNQYFIKGDRRSAKRDGEAK